MTTKPKDLNTNEGEGSKTVGRDYDDAATKFAKSGKVDNAATKARDYVAQNPADAAAAERAGKRPITIPEKKS